MRIIAGRHRGRVLRAPEGAATRPTADRVRQALFDMLWHAPWGGRTVVQDQLVLDAFAGTGALGLEALSRGANHATFIETDRAALTALRANIAACKEEPRSAVLTADATRPPRARVPCGLVFLDPPYGQALVPKTVVGLHAAGWIAPGALLVAETAQDEALDLPGYVAVANRSHGAATLHVLRAPGEQAEDAQ
ncbi:16S rRNA (guanine(966)-N(2))-methyltransferase RsmD [Roseomonas terrae]|jgi:16S rRNA (guanine966-N2)-methyltransferase|uniref:16S rRNA (Guanine(966)-N(2))-methyltransferase RsmD n=1 Tax=Neoroseomonas terrae TaxID=424799 RepID=A0ABS5EN56_9PROT|nr:16S rRNA (guanine(966)-N(2))-methyltransferase RsmD [Neoroseomonas terrae]MBR0652465.1 16S rRNA (guanine(966)-N(2))-methyltransferase RsmD [Neoroseomonas terrae]